MTVTTKPAQQGNLFQTHHHRHRQPKMANPNPVKFYFTRRGGQPQVRASNRLTDEWDPMHLGGMGDADEMLAERFMFLDNQDLFLDAERLLSVGPMLEAPLEAVEYLTEPTHYHQSVLSERAVSWLPSLRGRKPAHLRATRGHLRDLVYKYWVLTLIRDVNSPFLQEVISKQPKTHWNDLFGAFLHWVEEEDWFPIDWMTLNWLHEI